MTTDPNPGAVRFLAEMFRDVEDGWVHLFHINRTDGTRGVTWQPVDHLDDLSLAGTNLSATSDVWFGPATRNANMGAQRGGSDDCEQICAVWVDIDVEGPTHKTTGLPPTKQAARQLIADYPVPPTAIIDTGGGLQPWWLLSEPLDRKQAEAFLTRWGATWAELGAHRGWHVDNVFDIARVMRLPGTWNRKADTPQEVYCDTWTGNRYGVDDLDQWCITPPEPPVADPFRTRPYIGTERPGDAFNTTTDPGILWEQAGFTLDRSDRGTGDRHYTAPHHAGERGSTGLTVYTDGHSTLWSETFAATHQMAVRRPYDAFGVYTHLNHHGDWRLASDELAVRGYGTPRFTTTTTTTTTSEVKDDLRSMLVVWPTFWAADTNEADWIAEPCLARGRSHAIVAKGGTGKSLFTLWLCARLATGQHGLTGEPMEPIDVLYLDFEMTADDLRERLEAMGFGPGHDMSRLHYALLPSIPPADTKEGGAMIAELAALVGAQLVVIDTFSRAVSGDENDADTVRSWYRWTGIALKAAGRAFVRIDHLGKDIARGARGSSAKNDDVDIVWQMAGADNGFVLTAVKRRMGWVPETLHVSLIEEPVLHYRTAVQLDPEGTKQVIADLDAINIGVSASYRFAADELRKAGKGARVNKVRAAQKARSRRHSTFTSVVQTNHTTINQKDDPSESRNLGLTENRDGWDSLGTHSTETPSDQPGLTWDSLGLTRATQIGMSESHVVGLTHERDQDQDDMELF